MFMECNALVQSLLCIALRVFPWKKWQKKHIKDMYGKPKTIKIRQTSSVEHTKKYISVHRPKQINKLANRVK